MPLTPAQTGNVAIDGLIPWIGLMDRLARDAPAVSWLVWMLLATGLTGIINAAGSLRSFTLSFLLAIPGAAVTAASLIVLTLLLQPLVSWTSKLLTLGVACGLTVAIVGAPLLLPRDWRPHARAVPLVVLLGRPLLVSAPALIIGVASRPSATSLALMVAILILASEIVIARYVDHVLRGASVGRSSSDLREFGSNAPVFVVSDDTFQFLAVTVGFFDASTSVFVREQVERALRADEPRAHRAARHVLAHEAARAIGRHTRWRVLAIGAVIAATPLVLALVPVPALAGPIAVGLPLATGVAITLAFEASARRFADAAVKRATASGSDVR